MFKPQYQINCGRCHQWVFVDQHKGPRRKYCDKCDPIVKGEQSAERMKELRKRQGGKKKPAPAKRREPSGAPVLYRAGVEGETPSGAALLQRPPAIALKTMPLFTALVESRRVSPITF